MIASPSSKARLWRTKASMTSASLRTIATPKRRITRVSRRSLPLRHARGRRARHVGQLYDKRVDCGLVDLHIRVVADRVELRVASFVDVALFHVSHDQIGRAHV